MDRVEFDDEMVDAADAGVDDGVPGIGTDERRMHVRAYNHWVSLLQGRAYPSIEDLNPGNIADFGPHSVLLDFSGKIEDPAISFLGRSLREECGLDAGVARIADVPSRSLLSRLTDHYLQIIANRAPIGFEAEFVSTRGHATLYRGILMPFSSDEDTIDYIYGVINWKEVAAASLHAGIAAELDAARTDTASPPVWADGPNGGARAEIAPPAPLSDQLSMARESAAAARAADTRTRAALYRALGRAHDFAIAAERDADGYARLLAEAGLQARARAPMTPIAKLVFGADYDKTRLTEFAAVLAAARAADIPDGGLVAFVEDHAGGIKGVVAATRAARRPAVRTPAPPFGDDAPLARVALDLAAGPGEPILLVARAGEAGVFDIVAALTDEGLIRRALALHRGKA